MSQNTLPKGDSVHTFAGAKLSFVFGGAMVSADTPSSFKTTCAIGNLTPKKSVQHHGGSSELVCWHGPTESFFVKLPEWDHVKKYIDAGVILDNPIELSYDYYAKTY